MIPPCTQFQVEMKSEENEEEEIESPPGEKEQVFVDTLQDVLNSRFGGLWHVIYGRDMGFACKIRKGTLGNFEFGFTCRKH